MTHTCSSCSHTWYHVC